jgi:hypothetical protein
MLHHFLVSSTAPTVETKTSFLPITLISQHEKFPKKRNSTSSGKITVSTQIKMSFLINQLHSIELQDIKR